MRGKSIQFFIIIKCQKEGSHCTCLSVVLIDYVFKLGKSYYHQVCLEECKYIVKEKPVTKKYINEDLKISSNNLDKSDEE